MRTFKYVAQQYASRKGGSPLLLFVAPAGEIREWAGVPRKAFDYLNGFQRSLDAGRVADVASYYAEDERNVSPTAVVVGFGREVLVTPAAEIQLGSGLQAVEIRIEVPDYAKETIETLAQQVLRSLETRLQRDAIEAIHEHKEEAAVEAQRLEDEQDADQQLVLDYTDERITQSDRSFLEDFYAQLLSRVDGSSPWPSDPVPLREVLYSLLKPAIIVDGQHRVFGAAEFDPKMQLAVCAIPESNWAENVYQFVVINQKAKPIRPAFLSAIIANSLSQNELAEVYDRLTVSDVDIERSKVMDRVNSDPASPFNSMIDFEVPNSGGFLSFPGMWRLVDGFHRIESTHPVLLPNGNWPHAGSDSWISFFFAFWDAIKTTFSSKDARLWRKPEETNTNNLLKIVTLQEMQSMTLDLWADSRIAPLGSPEDTRLRAVQFWDDFPSEFFTDVWKLKGLQTAVGRGILHDALIQTRRKHGTRTWTYRKLALFQG